MEFDFLADALHIRVSDGGSRDVALAARSVADFHREVFSALKELQIRCSINPVPSECEDTIPLDTDTKHCAYDREYVLRFWRILALSDEVFTRFRARFLGKCSPVHFFWGSFDLAVTRFSGRPRLEWFPLCNYLQPRGAYEKTCTLLVPAGARAAAGEGSCFGFRAG